MEYFGNISICHFNLLNSHFLGCLSGKARPLKHRWKEEISSTTGENVTTAGRYFKSFLKVPTWDQESMLCLWMSASRDDWVP